jgi:hypothetical protein
VIAINILRPVRKPSDGLIMNDLFPLARHIRFRDGNIFADVQCDVFRTYAVLVGAYSALDFKKN